MPEEEETELKELLRVCRDVLTWQKIAYDDKVQPLLELLLDEPRKVLAYYHSDGENTTRKLSAMVGAGTGSISRWWTTWINRGIAIPIPKGAGMRAKRFFDPEDYNIRVPDVSELKDPSEKQEEDVFD